MPYGGFDASVGRTGASNDGSDSPSPPHALTKWIVFLPSDARLLQAVTQAYRRASGQADRPRIRNRSSSSCFPCFSGSDLGTDQSLPRICPITDGFHCPPDRVGTPSAFNAWAIFANDGRSPFTGFRRSSRIRRASRSTSRGVAVVGE